MSKCVGQNFTRNARNFDVHLNRGDAFGRAGNFKVHVAERVFHALNVGQNRVRVAVFDETHSHAADGTFNRNARLHQAQRAAANAAH